MLRRILCSLLMLAALPVSAQVAGLNTLGILRNTTSARTSALGMDYLSVYDSDVSLTLDNPSLIGSRHSRRFVLDYVGLFAGAKSGSALYAFDTRKAGTFVSGLQFNAYGTFDGYDEAEQSTGTFHAADYLLYLGWNFHIDSNFSLGASFKPILSQYEYYTALAFSLDVASTFVSDDRSFAATLMARHIGSQLATFDGTVEQLPFSLSASLSYKLENAPFRLFFQANELQRWNLVYDDPLNPSSTTDPFTGVVTEQNPVVTVLDNLGRHALVGVEATLKNVVFLRLGYSWRQTREMQYVDRGNINFSGFSYGFGIHARRFDLDFARRNYHLGQAPNYLTLSFRL